MDYNNIEFRISTVIDENGFAEIYFEQIGGWDEFDLIIGLLQQENNCQILNNQELIYIRVATLRLNNMEFVVKHDDMLGTFLYTENPQDVETLERLANNVIVSIKDRLKQEQQK
ncbi:MAG: hypothetical protein LBN00_02025 [Oscillospiraceae bacterium]|jgi:hypothetical protein|nr:hypothetical protein [Oscillospiraceae bacterium]